MRRHRLLSMALTFAISLTPVNCLPVSAASNSSAISEFEDTEQILLEDPAAYYQGNYTEILELQKEDSIGTDENSINTLSPFLKGSAFKKGTTSVSPFTGTTYTHADAFDGMNIYHGIDVSYYQDSINWGKVKAAGVDFAIIRMGHRGYSNGTLATDTKFHEYMQGAIAAGLPVGAYFFTEAITVEEAVAEAQYMAAALASYPITMPVAIDWEKNGATKDGGRKYNAGLTKEQNTMICSAFCDVIRTYGYTPMVYANIGDFTNKLDGAALGEKYEIWLARYHNVAEYGNPYSFWQYSSSGSVKGISNDVDLNFWYTTGSIDAPTFTHGASGAAIVPTPTPEPEELDDVEGLSASSASKNITLSWDKVTDATGYQIYRKDTYNGSYKKIKTLSDGSATSWKNTGLAKKHEYYYRIRAYAKTSQGNIYSDYSTVTAATKASSQVGVAKKSISLLKKPSKTSAKLVTVPKGTPMEYVGQTHLANGKKFQHVRYHTNNRIYDGYLTTVSSLKLYAQGTTTSQLNLRKTAGMAGKLLTSIPKNTPIPIMGKKKVTGTTWYKTTYSTKKGKIFNGYVSSDYVKK